MPRRSAAADAAVGALALGLGVGAAVVALGLGVGAALEACAVVLDAGLGGGGVGLSHATMTRGRRRSPRLTRRWYPMLAYVVECADTALSAGVLAMSRK
jgi:hypothetical protein